MASEKVEVECPVCDQKVPSDATRCPSCGAEFTFSGVEELQRVAQEINEARPVVEAPPVMVVPAAISTAAATEGTEAAVEAQVTAEDDRPKDKLLGKLFKKRR